MRRYRIRVLIAVLLAVILQTTVFPRPFGASPNLVVLVVIGVGLYMDSETAVVAGFVGGLLNDLLGDTILGLWALVVSVIAYAASQYRYRAEGNLLRMILGVFGLTVLAQLLFGLVGTLFGQGFLADTSLIIGVVLTAVITLLLATVVLPLVSRLVAGGRWFALVGPTTERGVW
jgi:rod shape-determining protein MreD